ncbi:hypothetical protein HPB50_028655 [Hyalomma asiaticum]|nr:hypothetical protein HPB50_028655 [Hyalomma asiaticum]
MIGLADGLSRVSGLRHTIYAGDITLWVKGGSHGHIEDTPQATVDHRGATRQLGADVFTEQVGTAGDTTEGSEKEGARPQKEREKTMIRRSGSQVIPHVKKIRMLGMLLERSRANYQTINHLTAKDWSRGERTRRLRKERRYQRMCGDTQVCPILNNVNPEYNRKRSAERARALIDLHTRLPCRICGRARSLARDAHRTEEVTIALALTDPGCTAVLSDSRTVVQNYARGSVCVAPVRVLHVVKLAGRAMTIKWLPAHMGREVSARGNANHNETVNQAASHRPTNRLDGGVRGQRQDDRVH